MVAIGMYVIGLSFSYVSVGYSSFADRGARYTVFYVARGGFITVLHRT